MNYYFYFRARWDKATIEFSKTEAGWENELIHARYILATIDSPEAGWLPKWVCRLLIWKGCIKFYFKQNKNKTI